MPTNRQQLLDNRPEGEAVALVRIAVKLLTTTLLLVQALRLTAARP